MLERTVILILILLFITVHQLGCVISLISLVHRLCNHALLYYCNVADYDPLIYLGYFIMFLR